MGITPGFRLTFCVVMTALLVLSGCNTMNRVKEALNLEDPVTPEPSEELLKEDARYAMADSTKGLSPMEAHMRARRMVDPNDLSDHHDYTYKAPLQRPQLESKDLQIAQRDMISAISKRKPQIESQKTELASARAVSAVAPAAGGASVIDVRTGDHPDRTRVVLDLSGPSRFEYVMDEEKNMLVIELPDARWEAGERRVFSDHPLLMAYLARPAPSGGTLLAIKMKRKAKLIFKTVYEPNQSRGHRIVFDVGAG